MPSLRKLLKSTPVRVALGITALGTVGYLVTRDQNGKGRTRKLDCSKVGELDGVRYVEHVTGGADPNAELPMLVVFHSLWATPKGSASFTMLPPTRVIRPYGPWERDGKYSWFTTRAKGDQEELVDSMLSTAEIFEPFLRDIIRCRPTVGRPVVTGSSQGGMMSYLMASTAPSRVRGAVAVAGRLPESLWNPNMAPAVGIHGTRDTTVSYEQDKLFADAMGFPLYSYDAAHEVTPQMGKQWVAQVKKMMGYSVA